MSINKAFLSGNLTADPELRVTQSGTSVLGFQLAVNGAARGADGEYEDRADFFRCTMFGNRAEALAEILAKGMKVTIEGHLRYSAWEKDGERRSSVEVIVDELELMQRRDAVRAE